MWQCDICIMQNKTVKRQISLYIWRRAGLSVHLVFAYGTRQFCPLCYAVISIVFSTLHQSQPRMDGPFKWYFSHVEPMEIWIWYNSWQWNAIRSCEELRPMRDPYGVLVSNALTAWLPTMEIAWFNMEEVANIVLW